MSISEFHFIRPYWLLAFLPLIIYIFLRFKNNKQQGSWQTVCDAELLPFLLQEKELKQSQLPLIASSLAAVLSITALAGPTWQRIPTPVFRNAAALVIALDLSRSMDATDIKPSRLASARYKIADLLKKRKDGQTALLVYANSAFTVTPLTSDTETINSQLSALTSDIMPAQGSNSANAIDEAVQLFKNAGLQKGQILLVTDDDSKIDIDIPSAYQLSILAVGTAEGAPIKLAQGGFLKDSSGNIVVPKLDALALRRLALSAGGIYQQITATDQDIDRLSAHFEQMAKRGVATENNLLLENWIEAGVWLLFPILFLSAFSFRRGLLSLLLVCLLPISENSHAFEWQDLWQTKDQQAQQSYLQGDYKDAEKKFTDPAWRAAAQYKADSKVSKDEKMQTPRTDTGFYNQGNVLAKSAQFEKAIKSYEKALKLDPDNLDAQYNKKLVEDAQDEQQQQNQDKNKGKSGDKQEQQDQQSQQNEQSDDNSEAQEQESSAEQQDSEDSKQQDEPSAEEKKPSKTEQEAQQPAEEQQQAEVTEESEQQSEQQQENEQWLKRIPDDPSGLLKRKFKHQYSRQKQRSNDNIQW